MEVITVTYRNDIQLLALQAHSLALNILYDDIERITVVINDEDSAGVRRLFDTHVAKLYGSLTDRVSVIEAPGGKDGWAAQQGLKLDRVRCSPSEYCLILDAKNHLVRSACRQHFIDERGRPRLHLVDGFGDRRRWLASSLGYFGVDNTYLHRPALPTTTPYTVRVDLMREMVLEIERREGRDIRDWFITKPGRQTEFLLYYSYLLSEFGSLHDIVDTSLREQPCLFRRGPTTEQAKRKLFRYARHGALFFGLHPGRMTALSDWDTKQIIRLWSERELMSPQAAQRVLNGEPVWAALDAAPSA